MKKYMKIAFIYLFIALVMGVFYREFTKYFSFNGNTTLSIIHVHFLVLGFIFFILLGLLKDKINFENNKYFKPFMIIYNIGLPFMNIMFLSRGIIQVLELYISNSINSMISGITGLSHILMLISLILLAITLLKSEYKNN